MNLKNKLIIFFTLVFSMQSFTQNNFNTSMASELHEKYWFYRERLKYFVLPGEGPGNSVVFGSRNHWESEKVSVGDQTIKLGWYLSVLATEYKLLGNQSLERDQTLTELYYAIKAFERLDLCETYDPWFKNVAYKDGFFMRCDIQLVNGEAEPDYNHLNFGMNQEDDFKSRPPGLPAYISDVHFDGNTSQHKKAEAMSQDQAAVMIMGFGMVIKCMPWGDITFNNTLTGEENFPYNFVQNAITNVNNIGDYIGNVDLSNGPAYFSFDDMDEEEGIYWEILFNRILPNPLPAVDVASYWTIFDPNQELVNRGPWVYFFRWGFSEAIRKLTGHTIPTSFLNDCTNGDGSELWWGFSMFAPAGNHYNRVNASTLAAIANSWDQAFTNTDGRINDLLNNENHQYLYLLAYILFQGPDDDANTEYINDGTGLSGSFNGEENSEAVIHEMLETAPWCGPYQFKPEGGDDYIHFDFCDCEIYRRAGNGWASGNRFRSYVSEQYGEDWIEQGRGSSPGLDYMLLYNLFHYYLNWWYGWDYGYIPYRNMLNSVSSQDYPYQEDGVTYGNVNNPANLRAFHSFTDNGVVSSNGDLNLVAGEMIKLTPGFHVVPGGRFSAKIEEFDCWDKAQNSKSTQFADNNYIQYEWEDLPDNSSFTSSNEEAKNIDKSSIVDSENVFVVIPNPANNQLHFEFSNRSGLSYQITIRDAYGKTAQIEPNYHSGTTIDISALSNGLYIAEVVIDNQVYQEKFVVL
ncbi:MULTISPECIES: T9SS type A sorting domain-containing protein [unclassified Lentimicrobium]|uniref:T9SS type A sorting domain-containing protein n=1 Tax=unclassified Lentimicrobium TaxID=2677434 RepID=UPI001552DCD3|nr:MULTISPECIES: T9SS type A sorting domain-containing protein [unclassified Lentimicrobium]NPD46045.1 T9SS type A sorting domain-containing protein [Lentimicrobium sp. S6]NPD84949.1 T9SS type A sorting domain-containing protein [Lentimicrobium sp. L6]